MSATSATLLESYVPQGSGRGGSSATYLQRSLWHTTHPYRNVAATLNVMPCIDVAALRINWGGDGEIEWAVIGPA